MNEPFNMRMFWFNVFGILCLFAVSDRGNAILYVALLIMVVLIYVLMTAMRIFWQLKRIADYLEKLNTK